VGRAGGGAGAAVKRAPTPLEILGGVSFGVPVWLPDTQLVCSRCFRVRHRNRFSDEQREKRIEPVCLECEKGEENSAAHS
jgi:hypothetical protein